MGSSSSASGGGAAGALGEGGVGGPMPLAGRSATQPPRATEVPPSGFSTCGERPRAAGARGAGLSSSPSAPTSALSADARTTPGAVARSLGESPIDP